MSDFVKTDLLYKNVSIKRPLVLCDPGINCMSIHFLINKLQLRDLSLGKQQRLHTLKTSVSILEIVFHPLEFLSAWTFQVKNLN